MGGMGEMMQEMMDEKEGLCLSNDQVWFFKLQNCGDIDFYWQVSQVHMMCGIGTKLQEKMDAALKQCVPPEVSWPLRRDWEHTSICLCLCLQRVYHVPWVSGEVSLPLRRMSTCSRCFSLSPLHQILISTFFSDDGCHHGGYAGYAGYVNDIWYQGVRNECR